MGAKPGKMIQDLLFAFMNHWRQGFEYTTSSKCPSKRDIHPDIISDKLAQGWKSLLESNGLSFMATSHYHAHCSGMIWDPRLAFGCYTSRCLGRRDLKSGPTVTLSLSSNNEKQQQMQQYDEPSYETNDDDISLASYMSYKIQLDQQITAMNPWMSPHFLTLQQEQHLPIMNEYHPAYNQNSSYAKYHQLKIISYRKTPRFQNQVAANSIAYSTSSTALWYKSLNVLDYQLFKNNRTTSSTTQFVFTIIVTVILVITFRTY
ncbi:hypothetical protein BC941DRAFT_449361 [Chlamydoabsidia padenii]|nr:hypothetical protein BC941DRAFT_449361 [Chlamydoabsidia padenii]